MGRFTCGVLLVLALFFAILGIWGFDVFFNFLLIGFLVSSLGLVLMPRRGPQHAYRNWYRFVALLLSLGVSVYLIGMIFAIAKVVPDNPAEPASWGMMILMIAGVYVFANLLGPPTRSRWWLRRKYPRAAAAIERYRKPGEVRETYVPAVVLGGRRCFLVFYYDKKKPDQLRGALLLDEDGRVLDDPALAQRVGKASHLARETIDYYRHQARVRLMLGGERAIRGTKYVFQTLLAKKERFAAQGPQVLADWERVTAVEEPTVSTMEAVYAMKILESQWAKEHRLGRLTEIREEEYLEFERRLLELRRPYETATPLLAESIEPARRLAEVVRGMGDVPHGREVAEGLLGIADSGESLRRGEWRNYQYAYLWESDWQLWRDRTAWAKEVEAARGELGMATP